MLTALSPLFNNQTLPNTTDNAAGAVARMIIAHPEAVPLDQVLPVFINALPLKADYEENQPVFECIFKLFGANNTYVSSSFSKKKKKEAKPNLIIRSLTICHNSFTSLLKFFLIMSN